MFIFRMHLRTSLGKGYFLCGMTLADDEVSVHGLGKHQRHTPSESEPLSGRESHRSSTTACGEAQRAIELKETAGAIWVLHKTSS